MDNYRSYVQSQIDKLKGPDGEICFEYEPMIQIRSVHGVTHHMNVDRFTLDCIIIALFTNYERKRIKDEKLSREALRTTIKHLNNNPPQLGGGQDG